MKLAVGFFDGIHLGHRRILADADAVLTFRTHPTTILAPNNVPTFLMTSHTRLSTLSEIVTRHQNDQRHESGDDLKNVTALDFTSELAAQSPEAFAKRLRTDFPNLTTIHCGANWTFGAHGAGNPDFLRSQGFQVNVFPYASYDGKPVSSTRIRAALSAGECKAATAMLGSPWQMEGVIVAGKGLARKMGFPTINVRPFPGLVHPPHGVYAVDTQFGHGIANYGIAPTMGDAAWNEPVLEVHVFADDVPVVTGAKIFISLIGFIRPEKKFTSIADLTAQISRDIVAAQNTHLNYIGT